MQYNMPMPPTLMGSAEQQLQQLHRYLFRMNEELNRAVDAQNITVRDIETRQQQSVSAESLDKSLAEQYSNAKALIIKTADIVRSEMDRITTELESKYLAISDFGTYQEEIKQEIEATATGIVQSFDYDARLEALGADFEEYRIESKGYICSGIIGYDDGNMPIYGIAVGQDLASTTITVNGEETELIDMTRNLATYTSDRITFWQNGVAVAYVSNGEMMINKIKTIEGLQFEDEWEVSRMRGGFAIKWIGGEVSG